MVQLFYYENHGKCCKNLWKHDGKKLKVRKLSPFSQCNEDKSRWMKLKKLWYRNMIFYSLQYLKITIRLVKFRSIDDMGVFWDWLDCLEFVVKLSMFSQFTALFSLIENKYNNVYISLWNSLDSIGKCISNTILYLLCLPIGFIYYAIKKSCFSLLQYS